MTKLPTLALFAFALFACQSNPPTDERAEAQQSATTPENTAAPEAAAAPSSAEEPVVESAHYRVTTEVTGEGIHKRLVAVIEPLNDFHLNMDYPWRLDFIAGAPITGGPSYMRADAVEFSEQRVRFEITPTVEATGQLTGNLRFGVCSGDVCENPRQDITWSLD